VPASGPDDVRHGRLRGLEAPPRLLPVGRREEGVDVVGALRSVIREIGVLEEVHHEDERAAGERAAVVLVDPDVEEPVRELARSVQRVKTPLVGSRVHVGPFQRLARIFGTALSGSFSNSTGSSRSASRYSMRSRESVGLPTRPRPSTPSPGTVVAVLF